MGGELKPRPSAGHRWSGEPNSWSAVGASSVLWDYLERVIYVSTLCSAVRLRPSSRLTQAERLDSPRHPGTPALIHSALKRVTTSKC